MHDKTQVLKSLTEIYGPSGEEEKVREFIKNEVKKFVDDIKIDAMGNLITLKKGNGKKKIMLAAHMDEIGLCCTYIDEKGFLRFTTVGGVTPITCLSGRVIFSNGKIGTIGEEKREDIKEPLKLNKMYIDIGAKDKKEAEDMVSIGDTAAFLREFTSLGKRLIAKAFDDRVGCVVLIQVIKELKRCDNDIYFVFTVQEEVGTRGAQPSAYRIAPDIGIAVDVTSTGDTPQGIHMAVELGKGTAIKVKDRGMITHPKVRGTLIEVARKYNIPYQLEVLETGATDGRVIQMAREGVMAGAVSIPCRYIHSPSEMVDIEDVENSVKLLVKAISSF